MPFPAAQGPHVLPAFAQKLTAVGKRGGNSANFAKGKFYTVKRAWACDKSEPALAGMPLADVAKAGSVDSIFIT